MKKSVLKIIPIALFMLSTIGYSQTFINGDESYGTRGSIKTFDKSDKTVKGTPYIPEEFTYGKISADTQGKIFSLRYDAFSDEIEFKTDANDTIRLNKNLDSLSITFLNGKKYKLYDYTDPDEESASKKKGYFVVQSETGKIPLLIKEKIIFIEAKEAANSYSSSKPAEFKRTKDEYYTINSKGEVVLLPKNKKDVANIFPEHSKDILSYIKSNKIKTNKEEDLIKLIAYINTL